jgi:hypothetical protein
LPGVEHGRSPDHRDVHAKAIYLTGTDSTLPAATAVSPATTAASTTAATGEATTAATGESTTAATEAAPAATEAAPAAEAATAAIKAPSVASPAVASAIPAKIRPTPTIAVRAVAARRVVVGITTIYISPVRDANADCDSHLCACLGGRDQGECDDQTE